MVREKVAQRPPARLKQQIGGVAALVEHK